MPRFLSIPALCLLTIGIYLASYALMIVVGILAVPVRLLFGQAAAHRWCFRPGFGGVIPLAGIRTTVTKHPDFDPERRGVFIQNHVSVFDGMLATWVIPHAFSGLFNSWHKWVPGYGWFMVMSSGIGVPPASAGKGRLDSINRQAKDRAEQQISILAFPEGHRTRDGKVRDFRRGSFVMAQAAGYPVIPLCVRGMWEVESKRGWLIRPGKVDVYLGAPIEVAGLNKAETIEVMERIRQMHIAWVERGETPHELEARAS